MRYLRLCRPTAGLLVPKRCCGYYILYHGLSSAQNTDARVTSTRGVVTRSLAARGRATSAVAGLRFCTSSRERLLRRSASEAQYEQSLTSTCCDGRVSRDKMVWLTSREQGMRDQRKPAQGERDVQLHSRRSPSRAHPFLEKRPGAAG